MLPLAAFATPGRTIAAAMIGTGHGHAASKIRAIVSMAGTYEIAAIAEPDEPAHRELAPFRDVPWKTMDAVLRDASIEVVALEAADPDTNLARAEAAIRAGKHIHLDKPPGSDLRRLRALLASAQERRLAVQMGYQWRYHAAMQAAIEAAKQGWLGSIYKFRASIDKLIPAGERRHLAKYRGGMMFSEGCHLIDRAVALLGKPEKISSFLRHESPLADGLADNTLVVLEYKHAIAEISLAGFDPAGASHRHIEIFGTNGTARVQPYSAPSNLTVTLAQPAGPYRKGAQTLLPPEPPGLGYTPDFAELAAVIRKGAKPSYSHEHDLIVQETLLRACGML